MGIKNVLICTTLIVIFICYAPYLPPYAEFSVIEPVKDGPFEGMLAPNTLLNNAVRMHEGLLLGPESIAFRSNDEIFVGVSGGDIVKIYGENFEKIKVVANNGPGCAGYWEEATCGRPLGIRFHENGLLYVTDAYLGVFAVDVDTGKSTNIFDLSEPIEGARSRLADDLDFDNEGNIYWSDASTVADLSNGALELYANPSGRLLKYDVKTKTHKVLLDKLHFANGVQLSPDKKFVLVNESQGKKILRYWLQGPKAGTSDEFISDLPGMPDNIRARPEGGYYIAIVGMDEDNHRKLWTFFGSRPTFKKFLCRLTALIALLHETIDKIIPNFYCKNVVYQAFSFQTLVRWTENQKGVVIELDKHGNILGSMQGSNGRVKRITEAQRVGDNIFFGSAFNNYLGRITVQELERAKLQSNSQFTPETTVHEKYEL